MTFIETTRIRITLGAVGSSHTGMSRILHLSIITTSLKGHTSVGSFGTDRSASILQTCGSDPRLTGEALSLRPSRGRCKSGADTRNRRDFLTLAPRFRLSAFLVDVASAWQAISRPSKDIASTTNAKQFMHKSGATTSSLLR